MCIRCDRVACGERRRFSAFVRLRFVVCVSASGGVLRACASDHFVCVSWSRCMCTSECVFAYVTENQQENVYKHTGETRVDSMLCLFLSLSLPLSFADPVSVCWLPCACFNHPKICSTNHFCVLFFVSYFVFCGFPTAGNYVKPKKGKKMSGLLSTAYTEIRRKKSEKRKSK